MAPASQAKAIRAPVLRRCSASDRGHRRARRALGQRGRASGRRTCRARPAARASSGPAAPRTARIGRASRRSASTSKASACSASPARIAVASSKCTWQVGRPRRRSRVVHRRQVVVDQRVGMEQLDRGARPAGAGAGRHVEQLGAGHDQERPQALAAAQGGVAHRLAAAAPGGPPAAGRRRSELGLDRARRPSPCAAARPAPARSSAVQRLRCGRCRPGRGSASRPAAAPPGACAAQCCLQRRAALVGLDRALEVELAALQLLDDRLELGQRLLEAHRRSGRGPASALRRRPVPPPAARAGCSSSAVYRSRIRPSRFRSVGVRRAQRVQMGHGSSAPSAFRS